MRIPGERLKTTRSVRGGRYIVALKAEIVIPVDDPGEPCYESETIELIREAAEHAKRGEADWLGRHGQVYELIGGASAQMTSWLHLTVADRVVDGATYNRPYRPVTIDWFSGILR
jgi:hypothetical protein